MPRFAPGQSGNPGGRPKGLSAYLRAKYGDDAEKIVAELEKIAFSKNLKTYPPRVKIAALRELLNRHSGKAPDMVTFDDDAAAVPVSHLFVVRKREVA